MSVKMEHIGIPVKSIEKSMVLYCDLLGFKVLCDLPVDLPVFSRIVFLEKDYMRFELCEIKGDWSPLPSGRVSGMMHLAVDTDDILSEHRRWIEAGMKEKVAPNFPNIPIPGEEEWWMCYFFGPDGESIEIRGPKR